MDVNLFSSGKKLTNKSKTKERKIKRKKTEMNPKQRIHQILTKSHTTFNTRQVQLGKGKQFKRNRKSLSPKIKGKNIDNFRNYFTKSSLLSPRLNTKENKHKSKKQRNTVKRPKKVDNEKKQIFEKLKSIKKIDKKRGERDSFYFNDGTRKPDERKCTHISIKQILNERINRSKKTHRRNSEIPLEPFKGERQRNSFENSIQNLTSVSMHEERLKHFITDQTMDKTLVKQKSSNLKTINIEICDKNSDNIFKSYSPTKVKNYMDRCKKSKLEQYLALKGKSPLSSLDISVTKRSEKSYTADKKRRSPYFNNVCRTVELPPKSSHKRYDINEEKVKKLQKITCGFSTPFKENIEDLNSDFPYKKDFEILIKFAESLCDENTLLEKKLNENYKATQCLMESFSQFQDGLCKKNPSLCSQNEKRVQELEAEIENYRLELREKDEENVDLSQKLHEFEFRLQQIESENQKNEEGEESTDSNDCGCNLREKMDDLTHEYEEKTDLISVEIVKNLRFFTDFFV